MSLSRSACEALDRMDTVATCWQAVQNLMIPAGDLQRHQRDNLAVLLRFLTDEYDNARNAFTHATHGGAQ